MKGKAKARQKEDKRGKKDSLIFLRVMVVFLAIFLINLGSLIYFKSGIRTGFTGFSVREVGVVFSKAYDSMSLQSKIFFIVQWFFLFSLLLYSFFRDKGVKKQVQEVKTLNLGDVKRDSSKTDLDVLYDILKKKKQLRIPVIAKAFKIDEETAVGWGKILESGDLAVVEYPGLGKPLLKLKEQALEQKKEEVKEKQENKEKETGEEEAKENPIEIRKEKEEDKKPIPKKNIKTKKRAIKRKK